MITIEKIGYGEAAATPSVWDKLRETITSTATAIGPLYQEYAKIQEARYAAKIEEARAKAQAEMAKVGITPPVWPGAAPPALDIGKLMPLILLAGGGVLLVMLMQRRRE